MYKPMLASFYFANKPLVMVPISLIAFSGAIQGFLKF
jgi:hypothetical protein